MHELYQLKEMLCKELKEYGDKGEMTAGTLEVVDKLAHTVKNLDKIIEVYEDEGNSGYYPYAYDDGMNRGGRSYNGSYRGRSYARRRDSMGRYSREGNSYRGGSSYESGNSYARGRGGYRGYSRDDGAKEEAMQKLHELMNETSDNNVRMAIQKAMEEMR